MMAETLLKLHEQGKLEQFHAQLDEKPQLEDCVIKQIIRSFRHRFFSSSPVVVVAHDNNNKTTEICRGGVVVQFLLLRQRLRPCWRPWTLKFMCFGSRLPILPYISV